MRRTMSISLGASPRSRGGSPSRLRIDMGFPPPRRETVPTRCFPMQGPGQAGCGAADPGAGCVHAGAGVQSRCSLPLPASPSSGGVVMTRWPIVARHGLLAGFVVFCGAQAARAQVPECSACLLGIYDDKERTRAEGSAAGASKDVYVGVDLLGEATG